ncbi:MAG: hypothetical protein HC927_08390, partial [Deltaproteobacteria bacterium]|nr:hypothetical protein [Deltaproteobacteria bacterium]
VQVVEEPSEAPEIAEPEQPSVAPTVHVDVHVNEAEQSDWQGFVLEVLQLLPPFLALPLFVMAFRQPRRRRG